ncbi:MAG: hypothetical protein M3R27_10700 [Bacteroidota bacterium]|nr:hypothetical protein [Bacteroidota bacterium]
MSFFRLLFLSILLFAFSVVKSQESESSGPVTNEKAFHIGLYLGCYFPNQSTAHVYDGYGFDFEGNKNSFENSFMYNKIILEYGGGYGQTDLIAQSLNVSHSEWTFDESDMPVNMRYTPSFLVGLNCRYSVDNRNAILFNINASKITATGNFTIMTTPQSTSGNFGRNIHTFAIKGVEQRLMIQVGYQHLFGENPKINFLTEGGLNVTMAKFDQNEILINELYIDLTDNYYQPGYNAYTIRKPIGIGFGAFAGLGLHMNATEAWTIQFLYNPSYEGINLVSNATLKFQHSLGLRAYYKL